MGISPPSSTETVVMPKTKVENGKTYELINHRWHLKDPKMEDLEVRTSQGGGKEYRVRGTNEWRPVDDSKAGLIARDMDANTFNSEQLSGVKRPEHSQRVADKPKVFGSGYGPGKPWTYDSPLKYLEAWALSPPKTNAGKLLFGTINTLSWFRNWSQNRNEDRKYKEQNDAIDKGFEDAMKNFHEWCGGIDPETGINKVSSKELYAIYTNLDFKMQELGPQYRNAVGKTDPDSLRIKTEYKAYKDMYNNMERAIQTANAREKAKNISASDLRGRVS